MKSNKSIFEMTASELDATTKPCGTRKSRSRTKYARAFLKKQKRINNTRMYKDRVEFYKNWIASGERLDELWERLVYSESRLTFLNRELEDWVSSYKEV